MKKILISALCITMTLALFSCTPSKFSPVEDIIKNPDNYTVKIENQGTRFPIESYEELEKAYNLRYTKSESKPNPTQGAILKYKVIGYGETNIEIPGLIYHYTEYIIKVEKIIKNFDDLFPDVEGKELTVMRGFYIENGDICVHLGENFPFIKGEEYYGIVYLRKYEDNSNYMADMDTFMAKDYLEMKEFEPYIGLIDEKFNYSLLRREFLEKYEGIKAD